MYIIALFTMVNSWKQLGTSTQSHWTNYAPVHMMEYKFSHKKEQNIDTMIWMKSHKHYAKQNKSHTKEYILYDFIDVKC